MSRLIRASGQLTTSDIGRVALSETRRRLWFVHAFLCLIALTALLLIVLVALTDSERLPALIKNVWFAPALYLVWLVGMPLLTRWSAVAQLKSSPTLSGKRFHEFDEQGFRTQSDCGSSSYAWSSLHGARETKDAFLLLQSHAALDFIPKRMFASPEDVRAMRELIRQQLGSKAKLQKR